MAPHAQPAAAAVTQEVDADADAAAAAVVAAAVAATTSNQPRKRKKAAGGVTADDAAAAAAAEAAAAAADAATVARQAAALTRKRRKTSTKVEAGSDQHEGHLDTASDLQVKQEPGGVLTSIDTTASTHSARKPKTSIAAGEGE